MGNADFIIDNDYDVINICDQVLLTLRGYNNVIYFCENCFICLNINGKSIIMFSFLIISNKNRITKEITSFYLLSHKLYYTINH